MTAQWYTDLPEAARARMAQIRADRTWGSALSAQEFAALVGVGFDPVGQVLGAAVFHIGYAGHTGCPNWFVSATDTNSSADAPFGELVRAMYEARRLAVSRAVAECTALGGDGIVGLKLRVERFPTGGMAVTALGTAVRARSRTRPARPFTSHVTGQEFGKLVHAGWIPVGLVLGICVATRHDSWRSQGGPPGSKARNREIDVYTGLIDEARGGARRELRRDAKARGGDGIVVDEMELLIREWECPRYENQHDRVAEALFVGTTIAHFGGRSRPTGRRVLPVMTLNRERL